MKKNQSGQTLIEAIVALVTILIIITAISVVLVSGISNSQFIKNQNEANKYAQQGMEIVRDVQQNNLAAFQELVDSPPLCIDEETSELYSTVKPNNNGKICDDELVNTAGSYNRTITFAKNDANCNIENSAIEQLRVTVTVKWSSSKCPSTGTFCHSTKLVSCMPHVLPASQP